MQTKLTVLLLRSPLQHPFYMLNFTHNKVHLGQLESLSVPGTLTEHLKPHLSRKQVVAYTTFLTETYGTTDKSAIYEQLLEAVEKQHASLDPAGSPEDDFFMFHVPPLTLAHRQAYRNLATGSTEPWTGVALKPTASRPVRKTTPVKKGRPPKEPNYPVTNEQLVSLEQAMQEWEWEIPLAQPEGHNRYVVRWLKETIKHDTALKRHPYPYILVSAYNQLVDIAEFYVPPLRLFIERLKRAGEGTWHWPPATTWFLPISQNAQHPAAMNFAMKQQDWDTTVLLHTLDTEGSREWLQANPTYLPREQMDSPWIDYYIYHREAEPHPYLLAAVEGTREKPLYLASYRLPEDDPRR